MRALIEKTHPEWHALLNGAVTRLDPAYVDQLMRTTDWFPGPNFLFSAFNERLSSIKYLLLGESPYPRRGSANGYAFWDQAVDSLWSDSGLSKAVNRATSLRNLIKMLLRARGEMDVSQPGISRLNKSSLTSTAPQLFTNFIQNGFLLLNASLVYSDGCVPEHARQWRGFMQSLFEGLALNHPSLGLVLFGRIALQVPKTSLNIALQAEHPYNLSFITNQAVLDFFKPLDLLRDHE